MASKKSTVALRKALTRAENEERRNRLELALLKAHEIKGCGKDPTFSELLKSSMCPGNLSPEEKEQRHKIWNIANAEYAE